MSIANYSVVGRILGEVMETSPPLELTPSPQAETADEIFQILRTGCVHEAPFATPFHFWAHALRALLEKRGRGDLFEPIATQALCRAEDGSAAQHALTALAERMGCEAAIPLASGYRMVDQDVMVSWVGEAAEEFVAFFWVKIAWLRDAEPFEDEREES